MSQLLFFIYLFFAINRELPQLPWHFRDRRALG